MPSLLLLVVPWVVSDITPEEFQTLHRQLQPSDQAWKSIPWQISLLAARQKAADRQKPMFIWAMDGHPLGCT